MLKDKLEPNKKSSKVPILNWRPSIWIWASHIKYKCIVCLDFLDVDWMFNIGNLLFFCTDIRGLHRKFSNDEDGFNRSFTCSLQVFKTYRIDLVKNSM